MVPRLREDDVVLVFEFANVAIPIGPIDRFGARVHKRPDPRSAAGPQDVLRQLRSGAMTRDDGEIELF